MIKPGRSCRSGFFVLRSREVRKTFSVRFSSILLYLGMKNLCTISCLCLLLSACAQPGVYIGTKFPKTKKVDVFHSATEVKRHYHVIGRLIERNYNDDLMVKQVAFDAKIQGGDAVIIIGVDASITGHPDRITADVLKYD